MAPYAHLYEVYQKLKYACAMLNLSGLVLPHAVLKQAYAVYDSVVFEFVSNYPFRNALHFERQISRFCLVEDDSPRSFDR